jgi:flagellar hook assembly protein FlgD
MINRFRKKTDPTNLTGTKGPKGTYTVKVYTTDKMHLKMPSIMLMEKKLVH